jgi:hypothetical protein
VKGGSHDKHEEQKNENRFGFGRGVCVGFFIPTPGTIENDSKKGQYQHGEFG